MRAYPGAKDNKTLMQILPDLLRRRPKGAYGLIIVLLALGILTLVFASLMSLSSANSQITVRNNLFNESEYAAESATENILAYMMRDFNDGSLGSASSYATYFPPTNGWPINYSFSCTNGDPNITNTLYAASVWIGTYSTSATNLDSQFAGLYGYVQPCVIASTATPQGQGQNLSATIYQSIQFALIPLFQYAIFYNMDLEINPGSAMTVNGRVHSNDAVWATGDSSSALLTFNTNVEAAAGIFLKRSTNDPTSARTGNVFFVFSNSINPDPNANVMTLPIGTVSANNNPTNVLAVLNPPPSAYAGVYSGPGSNYLENEADLIVSNPATGLAVSKGTNIIVYYQNPYNNPNYIIDVLPDIMVSSNVVTNVTPHLTNIVYAGYSFVTNVNFYDYREGATVQALQVNVGAMNVWLTNSLTLGSSSNTSCRYIFPVFGATNYNPTLGGEQYSQLNAYGGTAKGHSIDSIYVYNNVSPIAGSQLPGVRMYNAQQLPTNGLSVVTPQPMYVFGSYNVTTNGTVFSINTLGNTTNTYPAGLFADAVTILSSNWSDSYTSGTTLSSRSPASTTINAATLEGIVPSNGSYYSGGVENFLRLLENWGGTLTYNGSIVVMFPSQYATNHWSGSYYGVPTRQWGFDPNFTHANLLPPLTPQVKQTVRGSWTAY
jgi:hypothetical protein